MAIGDILKKLDSDGDGFDLKDIQNVAKMDFNALLGGDFLQRFTQFKSLQDLLAKAGVSKVEDLAGVDGGKLDGIIKGHSSFGGWQELLGAAKKQLLK